MIDSRDIKPFINSGPGQYIKDFLEDRDWMSSPARIFRFYPARIVRFSAKKLFEANGSDFQASLHTVGISL